MNLGRCPRRYQRQLVLGSTLPIVGLVNVRVAFGNLWTELGGNMEELRKRRGISTFGYNRWFQLRLGENIIRNGISSPPLHLPSPPPPHITPTLTLVSTTR